jgi:hypothetical protein
VNHRLRPGQSRQFRGGKINRLSTRGLNPATGERRRKLSRWLVAISERINRRPEIDAPPEWLLLLPSLDSQAGDGDGGHGGGSLAPERPAACDCIHASLPPERHLLGDGLVQLGVQRDNAPSYSSFGQGLRRLGIISIPFAAPLPLKLFGFRVTGFGPRWDLGGREGNTQILVGINPREVKIRYNRTSPAWVRSLWGMKP